MTERYLIPGSEWLFFKIYTGPKSADTLLAGPLRILVTSLLERAHIDSFFFIRYTDPGYHIRLRFHLPHRETGYGPVMCAACDTLRPLLAEGLVSSVVCDTYARELERYGEHTMEAVERYFHLDSRPVLELLHLLSAEPPADPEQLRWRMALRLVDDMCGSFLPELAGRKDLLGKMAGSYRKEFNLTRAAFTGQLNDMYRTHRRLVAETLDTTGWISENMQPVFARRKAELAAQTAVIRELNRQSEQPLEEEHLFWSLIHMTMNRWFRSRNRLHELVIYNFISRHYDSMYARMIYNK